MAEGFITAKIKLPQKIFEKNLPENEINDFLETKARELYDELITDYERYRRTGIERRVYHRYTQGKIPLPYLSQIQRRGRHAGYIIVKGASIGEPPQEITGDLKRSISVKSVENKGIKVTSDHPLSGFLEKRMQRPFIGPIVESFKEDVFIPELKLLVKELLRGRK